MSALTERLFRPGVVYTVRTTDALISRRPPMTNIEKWCNNNCVLHYPDIAPCLIIGEAGFCDICPYHFMPDDECTDECNAWGIKEEEENA